MYVIYRTWYHPYNGAHTEIEFTTYSEDVAESYVEAMNKSSINHFIFEFAPLVDEIFILTRDSDATLVGVYTSEEELNAAMRRKKTPHAVKRVF